MNIWVFNHYALPPTEAGGTRHFDIARRLVANGHRVTIIASSYHHTEQREMLEYDGPVMVQEIEGVTFCWVKTCGYISNNWRRFKNMYDYYRVAKKIDKYLKDKPDVCIGSIVHPLAPLAALKLATKFSAPFVYEIRDLWPQTFIDMGLWKESHPAVPVFRWMERRAVTNADLVINLSPLTDSYLKEHYGKVPSIYIPNGIDLEALHARKTETDVPANSTLEQMVALRAQGKQIVMFTGSIVRSNNLELLLDVAAKIENEHVHLAVVGKGDMRFALEAQVKERGIENLQFFDPVPKKLVPHLLKLADVMLLIQGKVMWGSMNKLFDYLSSGKPVISVTEALHNDPVSLYNAGIATDDRSAEGIAKTIERTVQLPKSEKDELAERGYNYVAESHDISKLAQKLETALQKLLKG